MCRKYTDIPMVYLVLWAMLLETSADSCKNIVRLADLNKTIQNQTRLMRDLEQVVQDQRKVIENQTRMNDDLKKTMEYVTRDVYFKVAINDGQTFPSDSTILWGNIMENVGGGYDAATGKFVAPQPGSYHFTVTVMNKNPHDLAYMTLKRNGMTVCRALAAGRGSTLQTGVCTRVVQLAAGDEVWVINPDWADTYQHHFTAFEGFMIHGQV